MSDSHETAAPFGRISRGDAGLGTVTPELVEERARELAKTDGRTEPNEADRELAKGELLGQVSHGTPPEVAGEDVADLVEWDSPTEASGHCAPRVGGLDDETTVGETLVEEGLEEADHDQRVSAADAFPPEE